VNVLGPNPQGGPPETAAATDPYFVIRRAIILQSILARTAPSLFGGAGGKDHLRIDRGVLRALLHTAWYKHGARSLEAVVSMSSLEGANRFARSHLPPADQLGNHVDATNFISLVHKLELEGEPLERLAEATHQEFCEDLESKGYTYGPETDDEAKTHSSLLPYADLPEHEKEQNRGMVRDIPAKLAVAGYAMMPARSDEPPFEFPGDKLDLLAEMEHDRWIRAKIAAGWKYAPKTDKESSLHKDLLPWERLSDEEMAARYSPAELEAMGDIDLPEEEKEKDRLLVRAIPRILARAGYTIVRVGE
jgi:hypothetical protein